MRIYAHIPHAKRKTVAYLCNNFAYSEFILIAHRLSQIEMFSSKFFGDYLRERLHHHQIRDMCRELTDIML